MSAEPIEPLDPQDLALARIMHQARRRSLTIADVADLDRSVGRVELLDGMLILTPNPDFDHQDRIVDLVVRLNADLPEGLRAYTGGNIFEPGSNTLNLIPDVLVIEQAKMVRIHGQGQGVFPDAVHLAIEVTSSNWKADLGVKRERMANWGVPYVVIDRRTDEAQTLIYGELPDWAAWLR